MNALRKTLVFISFFSLFLWPGCRVSDKPDYLEEGVSRALADYRKETLDSVSYHLQFVIPDSLTSAVTGHLTLSFVRNRGPFSNPLILDFKQSPDALKRVRLNGKDVRYSFAREHIYIKGFYLRSGQNILDLDFTAADQSLNRREDYLYTLLVPDRARTLFPCFDQPNLKAVYTLDLKVPAGWTWVGNSLPGKPSEPLSTYLFSFVAGKFQKKTLTRTDSYTGTPRTIGLYHRESDPHKLSQIYRILEEIFESLEWLEHYTDIAYPFAKYDCIVLPGFQYGGMEHTGATLYNDTRIFLSPDAGIKEQMNRYNLLSHETAHMWFGDYVTMDWFDDVWTKEVFANYFSALMMKEKYPDVDNAFTFIDYATAAYGVDRTEGTNAIKQPLDNLRDAGLIYGDIIYNKAPFVMNLLAQKMGPEAFCRGIRTYLNTYAYCNATWEDLIALLDGLCPDDLTTWSRAWVQEKGMPHYRFVQDTLQEEDPLGRGVTWPQEVTVTALTHGGSTYRIPNLDGRAYGYFELPDSTLHFLMDHAIYPLPDASQAGALALLNENYYNGRLDPETYINFCLRYMEYLSTDNDQASILLFSQTAGYLSQLMLYYPQTARKCHSDQYLMNLLCSAPQKANRNRAFSCLIAHVQEETTLQTLYRMFVQPDTFPFLSLTEANLTALCYQLAARMPDKATEILQTQRERITHPDRLAQFDFISQAVRPDKARRMLCFRSLLKAENRRIEPWAAQALSYLNHPVYGEETLQYLRPALDILEEIQITGDIFFPSNWLAALLRSHTDKRAGEIVGEYLQDNPGLNPLLKAKVLQNIHKNRYLCQ